MLRFNKNIKIGDKMIGPDHPTYFIAEIGGNFDGSMDKAKRLLQRKQVPTVQSSRLSRRRR